MALSILYFKLACANTTIFFQEATVL